MELLDTSCIFEILVRTHYPDLQHLFDVYPELRVITESQHFKDTWKKYNIHVEKTKIDRSTPIYIHMEVDRLGKYHGMTKIYENDDVLTKTMQFVDGLQQGLTTYYYKWTDEIQYTQYWFRGKKNGLETWYRSDGVVSRTSMYVNNKKHGLEISYGANIINWREWFNDSRHGKEIEWYPNGGRKREITWHHNVPDRLREWDENGTLTRKYFHVTKGPCSDSHLYPPQIG